MNYKVKFIDSKIPDIIAWGNLVIEDKLKILFRIRNGKDGPWVTWPSYKKGDKWEENAGPTSRDSRDEFQSFILSELERQKGTRRPQVGATEEAPPQEEPPEDVPF